MPGGNSMILRLRKVNLGPFRFEAKVTFLVLYVANAVDELAIYRELDHPVHADDVVNVPLSLSPCNGSRGIYSDCHEDCRAWP